MAVYSKSNLDFVNWLGVWQFQIIFAKQGLKFGKKVVSCTASKGACILSLPSARLHKVMGECRLSCSVTM
jgi:hypothetical protein